MLLEPRIELLVWNTLLYAIGINSNSMWLPFRLVAEPECLKIFVAVHFTKVVNHQYSVPTIYQRVSRTCI